MVNFSKPVRGRWFLKEGSVNYISICTRRFYSLCDAILNSKRQSLRSTRWSRRISTSVGAAATESRAIGYGGDALVSDATGLSRPTIRKGRGELESGGAEVGRIRCAGAGRPSIEQSQPGIKKALERFVDPLTRGDPQSPLRWTCKSRAKLAAALSSAGWKVSSTTVGRLLHELGYRLQSVRKSTEGASHPDRNAQFEHINAKADEFLQRARPVVSVDTKKKELVGDFKNAGREWQPKGHPEKSMVHDFPQDAAGKAIPYGIYDMGRNEAWVSVGCDHDTPAFAVASLRRWWEEMGRSRYPEARELFITADAGGSNGYRLRAWKQGDGLPLARPNHHHDPSLPRAPSDRGGHHRFRGLVSPSLLSRKPVPMPAPSGESGEFSEMTAAPRKRMGSEISPGAFPGA